MYSFHPQTIWALEQVDADRIGTVKLIRSSFSFNIGSRLHDIRLQAALAGGSLMDVGVILSICVVQFMGMLLWLWEPVFIRLLMVK